MRIYRTSSAGGFQTRRSTSSAPSPRELAVSVDDLLGTGQEPVPESEQQDPTPRTDALVALGRSSSFREAVREQAEHFGLEPSQIADDWLRALAGIEVGGRRPETLSDYMFIFEAARRAVDH